MIIMINGAFGAGKTTVASELLTKIENSMLYDPEVVGYMLRHIISDDMKLPEERTDNFQDLVPWKILVVQVAEQLKKQYGKNLIVPMTIYNEEYFQYIKTGFQEIDHRTYHFCLNANEATIHERLRKRGEEEGNWCFRQTRKCVEAFNSGQFGKYIETDNIDVNTVVDLILQDISKVSITV
jgi:adenylate kinase family enzyme